MACRILDHIERHQHNNEVRARGRYLINFTRVERNGAFLVEKLQLVHSLADGDNHKELHQALLEYTIDLPLRGENGTGKDRAGHCRTHNEVQGAGTGYFVDALFQKLGVHRFWLP